MSSKSIKKSSHPLAIIQNGIEKFIFSFRPLIISAFLLATIFLGFQASQLRPDASIEKMIPITHPYIVNFLENKDDLASLGNAVRIIISTKDKDIFNPDFQQLLQKVTDDVFFINGVDRDKMQSLWTPNVRWKEVTEEGFVGGAVIPDDYDGSPASIRDLRANTLRSGQVGRLVSNDFKAAIILAPLMDTDPETGERLDYYQFSRDLENKIRKKYQSDNISIHITGFVKVVGDLIEGAVQVGIFFAVAFLITAILLYIYSRCFWSTSIPLLCSSVAVVWQLGLLHFFGYGLDPYSMLVPFLVFAIGISHAVQMISNIGNFCVKGLPSREAARSAFKVLCIPGLIALFSDGIGFLTLMVIEIPVIQELAIAASLGVAILILTNLVLLPLLMSYSGISQSGLRYHQKAETSGSNRLWSTLSRLTETPIAGTVTIAAIVLFIAGFYFSQNLKIGDLDPGAPELRADSRYNKDNAFLTEKFSTSTDVFVVMVNTPPQHCGNYNTLAAIDRFQSQMSNVTGVQSVLSLVNISKLVVTGMNEGNIKWHDVSRNQYILNNSLRLVPGALINTDCSMVPVLIFLNDHKAETLARVVNEVASFANKYNSEEVSFNMAAGNSGIEAATNIVIAKAQYIMLALVYGVVSLLCLLTFRSIKTVICIILPLALTSVLAQALMTALDIGVKVATLPVIALGVGIGVDYGIYIYSKLQMFLNEGKNLKDAYFHTLKTTGAAVGFTGFTLAIGVGTWIYSPIKFQADMGIILTFMFLWNMFGALVLLPALSSILGTQGTVTAQRKVDLNLS